MHVGILTILSQETGWNNLIRVAIDDINWNTDPFKRREGIHNLALHKFADICERAGNGSGRRHCWANQMRPAANTLPTPEVSVTC
jgi:hypothetical protein